MILGCDLDGVVCDLDRLLLRLIDASAEDQRAILHPMYFLTRRPLLNPRSFLHPNDSAVIITGRPRWAEAVTKEWVGRYYPDIPVHFVEDCLSPLPTASVNKFLMRSWEELAQGKACQIRRLGVAVFFEDEPSIAMELRRLVEIPVILYSR